jgi:hypothetical protein
VAKQHGYKLAPAGKSTRVPLSFVLSHQLFKLTARKQLQQLGENAAYSIQGRNSPDFDLVLALNPIQNLAEISPLATS